MPPKPQAKIITDKTNIRYLSNFTGSSGFMLIAKTKKYLFTDSRYILRAKNTIKSDIEIVDTTRVWRNPTELKSHWKEVLKKHKISTLGIEEHDLSVARFNRFKKMSPKIKFTNVSGELEEVRAIKTKKEIAHLKKSQNINGKIYEIIKKYILQCAKTRTPGKMPTELEISWMIQQLAHEKGADEISFEPIVGFGPNSAIVHHAPTNRKLKKKDIVLIDMGMKYQGYCSDMSRTFFTAKPTTHQAEIYDLVLEAQENGLKNIKAGTTGSQADAFSRDIINKAGYQDYYSHAGGHGIGLDVHETPSLSTNFKDKFKTNMVVTVEPGIYLPGKFGVRIEDMTLITKTGNKLLTNVSKKAY